MDDLKIRFQNEETQRKVSNFISTIDPNSEICLWEPDGDIEEGGDCEGTWGMFIEDCKSDLWDLLVVEYKNAHLFGYNIEMDFGEGTIEKTFLKGNEYFLNKEKISEGEYLLEDKDGNPFPEKESFWKN